MSLQVFPSRAEFVRLAKRGNVIPVWGERLADMDSPVSAFLKLDDGKASFLLESVEGEERVARFSFLGSHPRLLFASRGREIEVQERLRTGRLHLTRYHCRRDPLSEIERLMSRFKVATSPGLPRFYGGLVGYLGYNVARFVERLPNHRRDHLGAADIMLMLTDQMVIFDHAQHKMLLVANGFTAGESPERVYARCVASIRAMAKRLERTGPREGTARRRTRGKAVRVESNIPRAQFLRMVRTAKSHIRAGDIIQVVLSQRLARPFRGRPLDVYRALRSLNPSPYMYFLRFEGLSLVGSSPEMLVRCEGRAIETRPIAGTRPRGRNPQEDERRVQQLVRSPKERAEHVMLVDLGRNDLGRVAQTGSVHLPEFMTVEKYSHVMHLVSGVQATLRKGKSSFDVLRAAFPAGTVTGAPKIRAMEIIAELEQDSRGPYAGAIGYLGFSGNLDTCITIRTIVMKDGYAYVQAGAGIVADSNPTREYQETLSKAKGMLLAIKAAEEWFPRSPRTGRTR